MDYWLRCLRLPEREASYWQTFPLRISQRLQQETAKDSQHENRPTPALSRLLPFQWKLAIAMALTLTALGVGYWLGSDSPSERARLVQHASRMVVYFQEIHALFPQQIQAIVFHDEGTDLMLSEASNLPESAPILLNIQMGNRHRSVITFSGQQIPINGELCEVFTDAKDHILVVGQNAVWTSAQPAASFGNSRIQACVLKGA